MLHSDQAPAGATIINLQAIRAARQAVPPAAPSTTASPASVARLRDVIGHDSAGTPLARGDRVRVGECGPTGVILAPSQFAAGDVVVQFRNHRDVIAANRLRRLASDDGLPSDCEPAPDGIADLSPGQLGLLLAEADAGDQVMP